MKLGQESNKRDFCCRMRRLRDRGIIKRERLFFHSIIAFSALSFAIVRNRFVKRSHPERVMLLYMLLLHVHVILNFDGKYFCDG